MKKNEGLVVQDWLKNLSFKQQAVLLSALRGCDGIPKEDVSKNITRNLRKTMLKPANEDNMDGGKAHYMQAPMDENVIKTFITNLDHYPLHFVLHLIHAIEIIGYFHPDSQTKQKWFTLYLDIVSAMHLFPESSSANEWRLTDYRE